MPDRARAADMVSGSRHNLTTRFAVECGLRGPLRFMVENTETAQSQTFDVHEPYVLIGRAPGCHLQLLHPDVSFRHAYCQVVQGRMYVFDLDSQDGIAWGTALRREGPLTPDTRLQIGPFVIRLSRAPAFTRSLEPTSEDWQFENEPLESIRLWFENATGRSSRSSMRPLRRRLTILGRSSCCHLRLSDASVSKAHCAIVRTDSGFWLVDLLGRSGTALNDRNVRFAPIGVDDRIGAGQFRLRIRELVGEGRRAGAELQSRDEPLADSEFDFPVMQTEGRSNSPMQTVFESPTEESLAQARDQLSVHAARLPAATVGALPGTSDALILAMMEQFAHLQQQLLAHTQQQMSMLTEMFATLHKAQNDAVMEQLHRIQGITTELNALKAERVAAEAGIKASPPAEAVQSDPVGRPESATAVDTPQETLQSDGQPEGTVPLVRTQVEDDPPEEPGELEPAAADGRLPPGSSLAEEAEFEQDEGVAPDGTSIAALADALPGAAAGQELDDSDVVPVNLAEAPGETAGEELEGGDVEPESPAPVEPELNEVEAPVRPPRSRKPIAPVRHDPATHARLTMRISELERERNSRWKRLMQLVGGSRDE